MTKDAIFMIEGGKALELIKQHIAERERVRQANIALADELGVKEARTDVMTGVLMSVVFHGKVPDGWTKPDRHGCSRPKKQTEWAARLKAQKGYEPVTVLIARELNVPTSIDYGTKGGGSGWRMIGRPLNECGFLWLSPEGPHAMWVPDVPAYVAQAEAEGYTVAEPQKSYKPEFEGCRRIEIEEWEILVAQNTLARKKAKAEAGEPA